MGARRKASLRRSASVALLALAALAGCESSNVPGVRFTVLEPSQPAEPPPAPTTTVKTLVLRADSIEVGVLPKGRLLTVFGEAPETGWYLPELSPRGDGLPGPDGFLEFDFIAAPPQLNGQPEPPRGTPAQRRVRADRVLDEAQLFGVVGVRVFAEAGPTAFRFPAFDEQGRPRVGG